MATWTVRAGWRGVWRYARACSLLLRCRRAWRAWLHGANATAAWTVRDASLSCGRTKTDPVAAPFRTTRAGGGAEVVAAKVVVTNLYTGSEPTPTTGEEIPPGYVENDDVYWLRYQ